MGINNIVAACCESDRRRFLKASVATIAAASIPRFAHAAPTPTSAAETVVAEFYQSLSDSQRKEICMPFDHNLRRRVNANWHVTKPLVGDDFYNASQQAMIENGFLPIPRQCHAIHVQINCYS